ncbi:hypothetical protein D3C85_768220 [compost metagenome]
MNMPVAVRTNEELDESLLLGHILFMTVDELKVHKDDLASLFAKHSLSSSFLPNEIKPHDAYRRASSKAAQSIEVNYNGSVQKARLMVREVKKDNDKVHRHLIRELIDEKNIATEYATVGKMIFNRSTEMMEIDWDRSYLGEYNYTQVLIETQDLFSEWTQFHTKDTVRNIVNKVVKSTHPVSIMQGGRAQFIPKLNRDILFNLRNMVRELPGASVAEIIPMIDTVDQRELITKNLEREVLADVDTLLGDFAELLKNSSVRAGQVKRYAAAFVELQEKTAKYEGLLSSKMDVLQRQLGQALSKIQSTPVEDGEAISEA